MRKAEERRRLHDIVQLRKLQTLNAQSQTGRATAELREADDRLRETRSALADDLTTWGALAGQDRVDPEATARWANAIHRAALDIAEQAVAAKAARISSDDSCVALHRAQMREGNAADRYSMMSKQHRAAAEEAALDDAADRYVLRTRLSS